MHLQHLTNSLCAWALAAGPASPPEGPEWWLPALPQPLNPDVVSESSDTTGCLHPLFKGCITKVTATTALALRSNQPNSQRFCFFRSCLERLQNITWRFRELMPRGTSFDQWAIAWMEPVHMSFTVPSPNRHSGFKWFLWRHSALLWKETVCVWGGGLTSLVIYHLCIAPLCILLSSPILHLCFPGLAHYHETLPCKLYLRLCF